jgi:hypothetical protein
MPMTSLTTTRSCSIFFSSPYGVDPSSVDVLGGSIPLPLGPQRLLILHPLTMIPTIKQIQITLVILLQLIVSIGSHNGSCVAKGNPL